MRNNKQPEIIAIGETMALITPTVAEPLETAELFRLEIGGAESNVAVHLAALGHHAAWPGHLGADALGRRVERQLRERGVDTSLVQFSTDAPTGFYFKDPGTGVIYHRAGSAASAMTRNDLIDVPIEQAAVTHISGITPALSATCSDLIEAVFERAQHSYTTLSFDVNYRASLWPIEEAAPTLLALAQRANIVLVGLDEAETLWGTQTPDEVRALLNEPQFLVIKEGDVGATEFSTEGQVFVPAHSIDVVEAVGAGDAFAAGYLSGYLTGLTPEQRLSLGHDRAALVLQSTTDLPTPLTEHRPLRKVHAPMTHISNESLDQLFDGQPLMAILRGFGAERSVELARTAWKLGIDCVEVPIQSERDIEALRAVVAAGKELGKSVGAGTVVSLETVRQAADAGAAFTVSPGFDFDVVRASYEAGMPPLPGVATASEVQAAASAGLTWVKAFPASVLGTSWFSAMAGPFPGIRFVATGGMDASNAAEYLKGGAKVVAVGSALADETQLPRLAEVIAARG